MLASSIAPTNKSVPITVPKEEPALSKILIVSEKYECSSEIATIVSMLNVQSIFVRPKDYEKQPQEDEIYAPNSIPNSNDLFIDDSIDLFREGEINDTVKFLMKHLSEREKHIVTEYYGLNGKKPKTLPCPIS